MQQWQSYDEEEDGRFDYRLLRVDWPFEIDTQRIHLFKHDGTDGLEVIQEVWEAGDPGYVATAHGPADWFLVGLVGNDYWSIPLCSANSGDPTMCRPIGVYTASHWVITDYLSQKV